ncbi:MAG TPA: YcaO-like family protein [Blastocatellia bacterium]|nr:YcaO-like family protein [Blastocatellia bacterium]
MKNNLDEQTARLLELVSPKVGIVNNLSRITRGAEEPVPPFIYQATLSHFDYRNPTSSERISAGKGIREVDAIRSAIGEAVERYCAAHFDNFISRIAPWADMEANAIAPPECVLYSPSQYARRDFPYHRWDPKDEVTWSPMRELPGEREILAPAGLVYLSLPSNRPEDFFSLPTSNGLAAGPNLEFAILNALYELIERDAFLITWMNRLPVARVDFSDMGGIAYAIRTHYARFGTEIQVFNLSTDIPIYVMMAVALDKTGSGPAALVSLGCHLNPGTAIIKALLEMCQVHPGEVRRYRKDPPEERLKGYQDVRTLEDHSAFTTIRERISEFSFLLETERTQTMHDLRDHSQEDVKADLDTCVNRLTQAGCRVLYADLTTPDVIDYGLRVVRAIATGLQPMHFGYGEERLGSRRLYDVPHLLGYASEPRTERDLNPCPHPLA